ncbi:MAG: bifunctional glutamate N-acetyltransferase/amino-acid acetyltransferase ArgJ [Paracoccaceae bacterium]
MVAVLRSPLAPDGGFPDLPEISGVEFATISAGIKNSAKDDVMLARLTPGTTIAGVFTKSATRSAAVLDCQTKVSNTSDAGAAILVNSGNANAFTGSSGRDSVTALTAAVADVLNLDQSRVFTASTGVIGEPLEHQKIVSRLKAMANTLSAAAGKNAAQAIMTTDTYPKGSCTEISVDGESIKISGFAKGSGMIAPDMATMLCYVFTDAKIGRELLQNMLLKVVSETFNCITVDSDTSTSDTLMLSATGTSPAAVISMQDSPAGNKFYQALHKIMLDLAHQVVRDGEGASKFLEVRISGAKNDAEARLAAMAIANSPLVKTAVAGEDPNWGRVVMAIGKSGANADRDRISIRFGDILVAENGWVSPGYSEQSGQRYMKQAELMIDVDLGVGTSTATVWTCDLTHGYIDINTDYRS